jgi:choline dehydrogenase-like flavoprotein
MTGSAVTEIVIEGGRATGVMARRKALQRFVPADLVVLAAGGFGTPAILERSGIECEQTLFVTVLTVAACVPNAWHVTRSMPFAAARGYIFRSTGLAVCSPARRHRLQDIVAS